MGASDAADELASRDSDDFDASDTLDADDAELSPSTADENAAQAIEQNDGRNALHAAVNDGRDRTTGEITGEQVRQRLRESGLARDVTRAFERFKHQDQWVNTRTGDRLDMDAVHDYMAGDYARDEVYQRHDPGDAGGRAIHVAVDTSGSMSHTDLLNASEAVGALHIAAETLGDELSVSLWSNGGRGIGRTAHDVPVTLPEESFEWDDLSALTSGGGTATDEGVLNGLDYLTAAHGREKILVVVTDGAANDAPAAKQAVEQARMDEVAVIGIGINSAPTDVMSTIFRDAWIDTTSDTLAEELVAVYREEVLGE